MLDPKNTIIVIIDVQGKLAQLMDSSDKLFANLSILVRGAKLLNIPIAVSYTHLTLPTKA